ncbi:phosphoribosylanthranilate isomerase [Bengtsoniella intestinalis]|uniref:phosphoribosylanthranilate isomerase n=1 Tax=Bengtsoniella intestinalis TaxID=3073143 RepID=UPI00391FA156
MTKIKICGLSRLSDVDRANGLAVEYVGFVFAESRRQVTPPQAEALKARLSSDIQSVGVFVNDGIQKIEWLVNQHVIDVAQLHGQEDEAYIQELKKLCPNTPIWKAVTVENGVDFTQWDSVDCFVLDNGAGGTGERFDWSLLPTLQITKPYFLAGGLTPENVEQALTFAPYGVDVSGGVETDGNKDGNKMKLFVSKVRGI